MIRRILKWIAIVFGSLVGLLIAAAVLLMIIGGARLNTKYEIEVESVAVPADEASVQRGEHVATIHVCQKCHTDNMGGEVSFTIPGLLSIPTPNLTSGAGGV